MAAKTGKLNQVETFYIDHHYKLHTPQELAEILNRTVDIVKTYIKKNITSNQSPIKAGEHFARSKGTVVMTETASMLGDGKRKSVKKSPDCVTKIKHD